MQWLQATIITSAECAELVSALLLDAGSEGVSVIDKRDVQEVLKSDKSWDYADDSLIGFTEERVFVSGFFAEGFDTEVLIAALDTLKKNSVYQTGSLELSVKKIESADWENEWRKYYSPIEIGEVAIVPKWLEYKGKCGVRVLIEPGMAFGTGKHETTEMCIALMQKIDLKNKTVADIGCGSGILGITALKLGAKRCVMSDIDEQAVKAACDNAAYNAVTERAEIVNGDLTERLNCEKADAVLCNLTADILLRLKPQLGAILKKGGFAIISGLIHKRADEVLNAYLSDFTLEERLSQGEWQAMLLKAK